MEEREEDDKEEEEGEEEEEEERAGGRPPGAKGGRQEYKQETVPGHPASSLLSLFVVLLGLLFPSFSPASTRTSPPAGCARYSN